METFIEFLKAILWPLTTITVVLLLKNEIFTLIRNMKKFKYGDFILEFGKIEKEMKEDAEKALLPELKNINDFPPLDEARSRLTAMVEHSPKLAILEAWTILAESIGHRYRIIMKNSENPQKEIKFHTYYNSKVVFESHPEKFKYYDSSRKIMKRVINQLDHEIHPNFAYLYIQQALLLVLFLEVDFDKS